MNSFSNIGKAIDYEFRRQADLIESGRSEEIVQETRLWNESTSETYTMRKKEGLADYRYFPEPDLPPLIVSDEWIDDLSAKKHELPGERRERYSSLGLSLEDVLVLTEDVDIGDYYDAVIQTSEKIDSKAVANWVMGDITAFVKSERIGWTELKLKPEALVEMIELIGEG